MKQELAKYRGAVTEMCTVFEDGLAKFTKREIGTVPLPYRWYSLLIDVF